MLGQNSITPEMLLEKSPQARDVQLPVVSRAGILDVTWEMPDFLDEHVDRSQSGYTRSKQLIQAIMGDDHFRLIYDESTRTADERFRDRRGNCLSLTNLFVAMARHLGIDARYQEVEIPPDWSLAGQSFLLRRSTAGFRRLDPLVMHHGASFGVVTDPELHQRM